MDQLHIKFHFSYELHALSLLFCYYRGEKMKASSIQSVVIILLLCVSLGVMEAGAGTAKTGPGGKPRSPIKPQRVTCYNRGSKCFLKYVTCPVQCPQVQPKDGKSKGCFLDCYSPKCEAVCRGMY